MDTAYCGYTALHRIISAALKTDRAGLRHAVSDGHHLFHDFYGTGRPGHNTGTQAGQVIIGKVGQVQFSDKHGGNAVQSRTHLCTHRRQGQGGVKTVIGYDHRSAMGNTVQVAQYHTETMIKRYGNTDPVLFRDIHGLADKVAVIEDIEMGQGCALGRSGRAAGELDINGVIGLQDGGQFAQLLFLNGTGPCRYIVKVITTGGLLLTQSYNGFPGGAAWVRTTGRVRRNLIPAPTPATWRCNHCS